MVLAGILGKGAGLQNTLLQLGKDGRLDKLIEQWVKYREDSSLPFDQASVFELMRSKHSRETPKKHPSLSKESFKAFIRVISSRTEPKTTTKTAGTLAKEKTTTKTVDTLADEKHETYYEIMKSCLALDRCDFIRTSINGPAGGDVSWRKSIDAGTQLLMEDLFHQVQRLLEYHLGLVTYLSHGLPYFRAALAANNGDLKKAVSIHYVTSPPTNPGTPTSVTLKDAPNVWIPKVFSDNGIEKSILAVSDKEVEKLISTCEHFWKAGEVIHLTTHSVCDMAYYIVHEGKDIYCEAIGTSDIPCKMCDLYVMELRNLRDQKRVKLRLRREMTVVHGTWTPPPHTEAQIKSLISWALGQLNTSMRMYLTKNGLRGNEVDQSVLDAFGLTNADLASME